MNSFLLKGLFTQSEFLYGLKIVIVLIEVLYAVFAFIVVRQVSLMNRSFQTKAAFFFSLISYLHLFSALGLVVLTLLIL